MNIGGQEPEQLTAVVERARSRFLANQALREAALAGTIALLGPTLLLLLGRQWLGWPMLALFALAGFGTGAWRVWRRRPDLYQVAQALDTRLAIEDQISTAIHFLPAPGPVAVEQRRTAARLAETCRLEAAFPFTVPRSLYALASVFLVASTLWALRYFLEKPLRLERSLPQVIAQAMRGGESPQRGQDGGSEPPESAQKQAAALPFENQDLRHPGSREQTQETSTAAPNGPSDEGRKIDDGRGQTEGPRSEDEFGDPIASDADNDAIQSYEEMLDRDANSGLSKADGKQGKDGDSNHQNDWKSGSQESNSLLSKLREAMNQMLSRLQQKSPATGQQQVAGGTQSNGSEQQEGRGGGRSGAGQPQPGGQEAAEGEGGESDAGDKNAQNSAGKNGAKSADGGSRGSTGNGAGLQDGDKRLLEARQQEALGKLSEIYGRRAASVTGEVTVETQSGKQTLRTPHASRQARHQDSGGEVSRDEIPLAYQAYIKEYFNRLRQSDKE